MLFRRFAQHAVVWQDRYAMIDSQGLNVEVILNGELYKRNIWRKNFPTNFRCHSLILPKIQNTQRRRYSPGLRNSRTPRSRRTWSCWRILSRTWRLAGWRRVSFQFVDFGQLKFWLAERAYYIQNVEGPAALLSVELGERANPGVLSADCGWRDRLSVRNDFDSSVWRN